MALLTPRSPASIIQGSKWDWEEQCTAMRQIHKDSFVTLAEPEASDCNSGFLFTRQFPCQVTLPCSDGEETSEVTLSYSDSNQRTQRLLPLWSAPLFKRAWVLQERLLSSRVLFISAATMYLECFTKVRVENCHYPINWHYEHTGVIERSCIEQLKADMLCFDYWNNLVMTYSGLELTNVTDKFPALSGLASEFHRVTKARYLAGHWREDMPRSLAWYSNFTTSVPVSDFIAPSWSWAAAKTGVNFMTFGKFEPGLEIIHTETFTGFDAFGGVGSRYIDIFGRIQNMSVNKPPGEFFGISFTSVWGKSTYYPDDASQISESEFEISLLYLGKMLSDDYCAEGAEETVTAIVIEPVDGQYKTYKRIGLAVTEFLPFGCSATIKPQAGEQTTLRLI